MLQRHWNNLNEQRAYPLDESASGVSDAGDILPGGILIDLALRWPVELGTKAWISSVTVTTGLVSLIFVAGDHDDNAVGIAALTVRQPIEEDRCIQISPLQKGVGGWAVLGSAAHGEPWQGRFSSSSQSLLAYKAARPYRNLSVAGLGDVTASVPLKGVVKLKTIAPLLAVVEAHEIDGLMRNVIVLQLSTEETTSENQMTPPNVFQQFAGPCAKRPESGTCGDPEPIEFISSVGPDCDGKITLEFKGCATIGQMTDRCGFVIDCSVGMAGVCGPDWMPGNSGVLPGDFSPPVYVPPAFPPPYNPPPPGPLLDSESDTVELPFTECFDNLTAPRFEIVSGEFSFDEVDPSIEFDCSENNGALRANDGSQRNVAVWHGTFVDKGVHRIETWLRIVPGGTLANAQLILNWRPHGNLVNKWVYHVVEINAINQMFRIRYFNGLIWTSLYETMTNIITFNKWFRIKATRINLISEVFLGVSLYNAVDEELEDSGPVSIGLPEQCNGLVGLGSDRSHAQFGALKVEAI